MANVFIEGFEHLGSAGGDALLRALRATSNVGSLFGPGPDGGNARIDGVCLQGGGTGSGAHGQNSTLNFAFNPRDVCALGFAVNVTLAPARAIQLASLRYDNGTTESEQCGLWVSPLGSLFLNARDFQANTTLEDDPIIIAGAQTASATFRFGVYNYLELIVDYSLTTPKATLYLNGNKVFTVQSASVQKMAGDFVSSVSMIFPCGYYFMGTWAHRIDDIYVDDQSVRGPQHIKKLQSDPATIILDTGFGGPPPDSYTPGGGGVSATDLNDTVVWALDNISNIGEIYCVGVHAIMHMEAEGMDAMQFGIANSTGGAPLTQPVTLSYGDGDVCFKQTWAGLPGGQSLTLANLNAVTGYLRSSFVFS